VSLLEVHRFEDRSIYKIKRNRRNPMLFNYEQLSKEEIMGLIKDLVLGLAKKTRPNITKTKAASDGGQTSRLAARGEYTNEKYSQGS
jgi:hypothetical protein